MACLCLGWSHYTAHATNVDSLEYVLSQAPEDSSRFELYRGLIAEYQLSNLPRMEEIAREEAALARKLGIGSAMADGAAHLGLAFDLQGEFDSAIVYYGYALNAYEALEDSTGIALTRLNTGIVYYFQGDYNRALTEYLYSLPIWEAKQDTARISACYNNIGSIHEDLENIPEALAYQRKSLALDEAVNDKAGIASSYNNLGILYRKLGRYNDALDSYLKALTIRREMEDRAGMSKCYNNLGSLLSDQGDAEGALNYYRKCLILESELGLEYELGATYLNIGEAMLDLGETNIALAHLDTARQYNFRLGMRDYLQHTYRSLARAWDSTGVADSAYHYLLLYDELKDSLHSQANARLRAEMENKYHNARNAERIANLEADTIRYEAESTRKDIFNWGLGGGGAILIVIALFLYRQGRARKRLNDALGIRNREIGARNEQIKQQRDQIRLKNQSITDSIRYAQRIQEAILPGEEPFHAQFPDSFVFYRPKDIVSGDFYWIFPQEKQTLFAAVDCTGHGVPGAFMSLVGYNGLQRAVREESLQAPGEILNALDRSVRETIKRHSEGETQIKDGMDLSLCAIDHENKMLRYAGANNPLYIVRKDAAGTEFASRANRITEAEDSPWAVYEFKATKRAIGYDTQEEAKHFPTLEIPLQKGDQIYLFTDGYADQFGGKYRKKFMYRRFKQVLLRMVAFGPVEKQIHLKDTFERWQGEVEQVDDVCVIGVRI